ncbi:RHS repeat-associated core domain-containing protein [Massilia timonae]|uniref:RHS repeat-associated core domain-containing protein n=1 Tax=Massilia timonae TaxID=47229 RepID=UPI00351D260A
MHYNRYRYYDPDTARYLPQDPIGLVGGFHIYSYTRNPTGWTAAVGLSGGSSQRRNEMRAQAKSSNVTCHTSCPCPSI